MKNFLSIILIIAVMIAVTTPIEKKCQAIALKNSILVNIEKLFIHHEKNY